MALVEIPCRPSGQPQWEQRTQLNGVEYLLTFAWSQREGHWSLSIDDAHGNPLHTGLVFVAGIELVGQLGGVRRVPGGLIVIDTTGANDLDPGFADLGGRFALVYVERPT